MSKKIITLFLIFSLLIIPTSVFAEENSFIVNSNDSTESEVNSFTALETNDLDSEPNQEEETNNLEDSIIQNASIISTDVNECTIKWDKLEGISVTLHILYGDVDTTVTTQNSKYIISGIPFGENIKVILSTDEEHKSIELTCNPSDDFEPIEIRNYIPKNFSKVNSALRYYCSMVELYTKAGNAVGSNYYSFEGPSVTESGIYNAKIVFKGKYQNYKSLPLEVKVLPNKPTVGYNPFGGDETSLMFSARCYNDKVNYIIADISTDENFSNVTTKKLKPQNTSDFLEFKFTCLKTSTLYYIRIKSQKISNGKSLYSEPSIIQLRTTDKMPTYSWTQKDVKN